MSGHDDTEAVWSYLQSRGCGDAVVRGGMPYLIKRWGEVAHEIERGYSGNVDDYLNDMDVRQIIADVRSNRIALGSEEAAIDLRLRPLLTAAAGCLWGAANAAKHHWTAERNWWYFTYPRNAGGELHDDLARRHLLGTTFDEPRA